MNKLTSKIRTMGSPEAWRTLIRRHLEQMRGLDFESIVHPGDVGLDPALSFRCSPSGNRFLEAVLRDLTVDRHDRIIDIGCGKGSAMRTMLRHPFSKVAGIELAPAIAGIAKENFRLLREERTAVHNADAALFEQYSDFNFFYLYNPFPASVMEMVLDRIQNSPNGEERIFIYNNPTCHQIFLSRGLRHVHTFPDQWGNGIHLYTTASLERSRLQRIGVIG